MQKIPYYSQIEITKCSFATFCKYLNLSDGISIGIDKPLSLTSFDNSGQNWKLQDIMYDDYSFGCLYSQEIPSLRFKPNPELKKIFRSEFKKNIDFPFSWSFWSKNGDPTIYYNSDKNLWFRWGIINQDTHKRNIQKIKVKSTTTK